jgi:hypothetical protein
MYPAGRIMHLVPARLVPGTPAYEAAAAAAAAAAAQEEAAAKATGEAGTAEGQEGVPTTAAESTAEPAADSVRASSGASAGPSRAKHSANLSVSDLMAGEGLLGRRTSNGAAAAGAAAAAAAEDGEGADAGGSAAAGEGGAGQQPAADQQQQVQPIEEMLLLDCVPQEAYARIKLCRWVGDIWPCRLGVFPCDVSAPAPSRRSMRPWRCLPHAALVCIGAA